ncbi:alpha/beta hydrolase [Kribbella sp. NPDC048915]|uniref:alpha/beta hydrolase n=1 Tax=Kribbella sp. NPDC048915 TaxID=3155148 RepID=UPI0033D564D7
MIDADQLAERFRANHARLLGARDRLQAAVDAGTAGRGDQQRLDTLNELLTPVTVSEVDANGNVVEVQRPRQFYSVNPEGQGRAVEVLGDLQQARNVAVLVPGMGNSLDTFRGQSDRGDLIRDEAGPGTAVVVWMDYDSPHGLVQAASNDAAIAGGPRLAGFLNELNDLKAEDADVTVVAHSYGTDVAARAVMAGAHPTRLVMTGSPGIAKYVDEAADFVQPPTRLYTERAPRDYVSYSEWHGPDPATFPDAVRMATSDPRVDDDPVSVHWHNQYYRPNSEALRNIGRVVRGDLTRITTTNTSRSAETQLLLGASWGDPLNKVASTASKVYDGVAALTNPTKESAGAAAGQNGAVHPDAATQSPAARAATGRTGAGRAGAPRSPGAARGAGGRHR